MPGPRPWSTGDDLEGEAQSGASDNGSDGKGDSGTESDIATANDDAANARKVNELEHKMLHEESRLTIAKKELELLNRSKVVALNRLMDAQRQVLKAAAVHEQGLAENLRAVHEHEAQTDFAKQLISRADLELEQKKGCAQLKIAAAEKKRTSAHENIEKAWHPFSKAQAKGQMQSRICNRIMSRAKRAQIFFRRAY